MAIRNILGRRINFMTGWDKRQLNRAMFIICLSYQNIFLSGTHPPGWLISMKELFSIIFFLLRILKQEMLLIISLSGWGDIRIFRTPSHLHAALVQEWKTMPNTGETSSIIMIMNYIYSSISLLSLPGKKKVLS